MSFFYLSVTFISDGRVLSSSQICHANYHLKNFLVNFLQRVFKTKVEKIICSAERKTEVAVGRLDRRVIFRL